MDVIIRATPLPPVLPSPQPEKKRWELEMPAANRIAHDLEDTSGQHLLMHQSIDEGVPAAMQRQAVW
jgi:FtsZ-interacting cell division protein ZipA